MLHLPVVAPALPEQARIGAELEGRRRIVVEAHDHVAVTRLRGEPGDGDQEVLPVLGEDGSVDAGDCILERRKRGGRDESVL